MGNMNINSPIPIALVYILFLWSILWKGLALWNAARNSQRNWFIVLILPLNTLGILEIAFLFFFSKKKMKMEDLMFWNK